MMARKAKGIRSDLALSTVDRNTLLTVDMVVDCERGGSDKDHRKAVSAGLEKLPRC